MHAIKMTFVAAVASVGFSLAPSVASALPVSAFARPTAGVGRQAEKLEAATVWVLPNPSGLNANYRTEDLARLFRELREAAEREP